MINYNLNHQVYRDISFKWKKYSLLRVTLNPLQDSAVTGAMRISAMLATPGGSAILVLST